MNPNISPQTDRHLDFWQRNHTGEIEIHTGEKDIFIAAQTGCLHVEECK